MHNQVAGTGLSIARCRDIRDGSACPYLQSLACLQQARVKSGYLSSSISGRSNFWTVSVPKKMTGAAKGNCSGRGPLVSLNVPLDGIRADY
jgi:hypothetical protein